MACSHEKATEIRSKVSCEREEYVSMVHGNEVTFISNEICKTVCLLSYNWVEISFLIFLF